MIRRAAWLAAAGIVGGCTVGPNFKPPQPGMPEAYSPPTSQPTTHQSVVTENAADLNRWWETFNDPVLNSLVSRAIANNIDIKIANTRIRQARSSRTIALAGAYPTVESSGAYTRAGRSDVTSDNYDLNLSGSYEIDAWGAVRRSIESSDATLLANVEDRRNTTITLIASIATDYLSLRSSQRQIEIANNNLDIQKHNADLTQRQKDAGFVGGLDAANANASVYTTEAQIPLLEQSARQAIFRIALQLGLPPRDLLNELLPHVSQPAVPPEIPAGLPSELLRRRPDIRLAEANLHAATANVGIAMSDLYPRFNLIGTLQFNGDTIKHAASWNSNAFSVGPNFSWPIFDAGQIRANIDIQNARADQALLVYERAVLNALSEVESALIAYEKEQQFHDSIVKAVDANQQALDYSTQLYQGGQTDFLNVLNAQRSLLSTQDSLVQSDQRIATNLVTLYQALGGGWDPAKD